jgi:hypothetical protein
MLLLLLTGLVVVLCRRCRFWLGSRRPQLAQQAVRLRKGGTNVVC